MLSCVWRTARYQLRHLPRSRWGAWNNQHGAARGTWARNGGPPASSFLIPEQLWFVAVVLLSLFFQLRWGEQFEICIHFGMSWMMCGRFQTQGGQLEAYFLNIDLQLARNTSIMTSVRLRILANRSSQLVSAAITKWPGYPPKSSRESASRRILHYSIGNQFGPNSQVKSCNEIRFRSETASYTVLAHGACRIYLSLSPA